MNKWIIIGVVLVAFGISALIFEEIPYSSQKDTVQVGPIQAQAVERKAIPLPPLLGAVSLAGGIALIAIPAFRRSSES